MKRIIIITCLLSACGQVTTMGDCLSHNKLANARCDESVTFNKYQDCLGKYDEYICEPMRQEWQNSHDYVDGVKSGLIK